MKFGEINSFLFAFFLTVITSHQPNNGDTMVIQWDNDGDTNRGKIKTTLTKGGGPTWFLWHMLVAEVAIQEQRPNHANSMQKHMKCKACTYHHLSLSLSLHDTMAIRCQKSHLSSHQFCQHHWFLTSKSANWSNVKHQTVDQSSSPSSMIISFTNRFTNQQY